MDKKNLDKIAAELQKFITQTTKHGMWTRSYEGEEPTKENLKNSIPWTMVGVTTDADADYVMGLVYPKLRKNGVLAKLRA